MKIAGILNSDNYMEFSLRVFSVFDEITPISANNRVWSKQTTQPNSLYCNMFCLV